MKSGACVACLSLAVSAVLTGAGCGSAHTSTAAKNAYVKRMQAIAERYGPSASEAFRLATQSLGRDNARAAQQLARAARIYAREANALTAITPPKEVAQDHRAIVAWLRGLARFQSDAARFATSSGASVSLLKKDVDTFGRGEAALQDLKRKGYRVSSFTGGIEQRAREALASETIDAVPKWIRAEKLPPGALPGAKLFAVSGCTACHTYLGSGSANLGAPDLTAIGRRHLGVGFQIRHLECPSCVKPGSPMPKFAALGESRLRELAIFLESSKGKR